MKEQKIKEWERMISEVQQDIKKGLELQKYCLEKKMIQAHKKVRDKLITYGMIQQKLERELKEIKLSTKFGWVKSHEAWKIVP